MTHEHFFPRWLIEYADVRRDGINWLGTRGVSPNSATVPLCGDCNNAFANSLEGPVSQILREIEAGQAISDIDCELIVRWMWKFEGLQWHQYVSASLASDHQYTPKWSLRNRVTEPHAFAEIKSRLMLALAMCHTNDPGYEDWPLGLDTPPGDDAITMTGVFRRVAIITSLSDFADEIPDVFGKYRFWPPPVDREAKIFTPPCSFPTGNDAIAVTKATALRLSAAHRALGQQLRQELESARDDFIFPVRYRIELPPT